MSEVVLSREQLLEVQVRDWYASPAYRALMEKQAAQRENVAELAGPAVVEQQFDVA